MEFSVAPDLAEKLHAIDSFVRGKLFPLEALLLRGEHAALAERVEELRKEVRKAGWWAPHLEPEWGGSGGDLLSLGLIGEILGQSVLGHLVFGCNAPDAGNAELLARHGSPAQNAQYLQPLAAGRVRSCFAMTEPDMAGSNPTRLGTTAVREGGDYLINGRKWFATAAEGAAFAVVMAVTEPEQPPHRRASMLLVPTDTPGYTLLRNIPVMGQAGAGVFSHGEIQFENCRVSADALIGEAGSGFRLAQERLGPGRIHHCMRWLGICRRALEMLCDRARSRHLDEDRVLADQQIVRQWIANSAAEIEAARNLVMRTAWEIDQHGFASARTRVGMIKYFVAGVLQRVVDRALQVHGALGMTDDTILAFFYREERAARIYDGADEVHQMSVAKAVLKGHLPWAEAGASK